MYHRAGDLYIKLGKWEDAKVMFIMCAEDYKTAFAHFNLGVACYNLGENEEAERVLSLVNYMDPSNAETWAYLALVLLKKDEPPVHAAYQTMNEAIKLGLSNGQTLIEICEAWLELGCMRQALETLDATIRVRAANCTVAEKSRALKQLAMRLKDKTEADVDLIRQVFDEVSQI